MPSKNAVNWPAWKNRLLVFATATFYMAWLAAPVQAKAKYIEFDVSGSQSTVGRGINDLNEVTGNYSDDAGVSHGFVRDPQGRITTFDASESLTLPLAINNEGAVAGYGLGVAFIRAVDGSIVTFSVPGATSTSAQSINNRGAVAGEAYESGNTYHAFLRTSDGTIQAFDVANATSTIAVSINDQGIITGSYNDGTTNHGFLRLADGSIVTFDAPGAYGRQGTVPYSIDNGNTVVGFYEGKDFAFHGFARAADGTIATFDAPHAVRTFTLDVASRPVSVLGISGSYAVGEGKDEFENSFGFLREPDGRMSRFHAPDAGAGSYEGTEPSAINVRGAVTGGYLSADDHVHGFLRLP